jgi:DNA polymerase I-like protein with 3'-5' exonuclease and polymerase domains
VPPEEQERAPEVVRQEMIGALASRLQVPLEVDMAAGPNWLDVKSLGDHA